MGWFDEQIRDRIELDEKNMSRAYQDLAEIVNKNFSQVQNIHLQSALQEICQYYHVEYKKIPPRYKTVVDKIDFLFRNTGVMYRRVRLEDQWYKDLGDPVLAQTEEGEAVAIIPSRTGHYYYTTYDNPAQIRLDKETEKNIAPEAIAFYEPLPQRKLTLKDIIDFMNRCFLKSDLYSVTVLGFITAVIGLISPFITQMLFDAVLPTGNEALLFSFAAMLFSAAIASYLVTTLKTTYTQRIYQQMSRKLRSSMFARVLSLPVEFFRKHRSGDLGMRILSMDDLAFIYVQSVLGTGITLLMSLVYVIQIFIIAPVLTVPALIALALQLGCGALSIYAEMEMMNRSLQADSKLEGLVFSIFNGIQKIKLAGAEKRAFARWAAAYREKADAAYNPTFLRKIAVALSASISVLGLFFIYIFAAGRVDLGQFVAFNTAYATVSSTFTTLIATGTTLSLAKPILDLNKPIFDAEPEIEATKDPIKNLAGNIELNNVSFQYNEEGPKILDNLTLKIDRGQYVAIVGKTGCGKSTLMRLLLGFETPDKGAIYYDGKDLRKIDKQSLRKKIGVVMQNGALFPDTIFENIAISSPSLTMKDAWQAAEIAGIKDDIEAMPMGMGTILQEGGGGISGGQRQRILIARAVAPKPKVLMLDEATSALDNLTQKNVSEALDKMKCTRIVIAHRLSTIKECDRIIVLDEGKIVEDGSYDELVAKKGMFADLVARQQIDAPNESGAL